MNGFQPQKKAQRGDKREQMPLKRSENTTAPTSRFPYDEQDHLLAILDRLSKENSSLKKRITVLEQELASFKSNCVLDKVISFQKRFESYLQSLEIPVELPRNPNESFNFEEMFENSLIGEEGTLWPSKPNRVPERSIVKQRESSSLEDFSVIHTQDSQLVEQFRGKEQEVQSHKDFIKLIKQSLESMLLEQVKINKKQESSRKEIQKLRTELDLQKLS